MATAVKLRFQVCVKTWGHNLNWPAPGAKLVFIYVPQEMNGFLFLLCPRTGLKTFLSF